MRQKLYNSRTELLRYGIREIVELGARIGRMDRQFKFIGENIGDPIAKGWCVPGFVKQILVDLIRAENSPVFGYTHSFGRIETRKWVAEYARRFAPGSRLDSDHVLFASGLGAAIGMLYRMLAPGARVIQPNPGYPAHISNERFMAGAESIGYRLDPANNWQPELDHLESQIRRHPEIVGVLLINPNNPTGAVYSAELLEQVVRLAERYHLMLISDEVYFRLVYNGGRFTPITELAQGRVPLVVMRGVSKDVPWPGARCGWLEFHNAELDEDFQRYFESIKRALMIEVCSTSLPQAAAPLIYDHPEYARWLAQYTAELENNSNVIAGILERTPGISARPIQGAFYLMALFADGALNARQTLPIANAEVERFIGELAAAPGLPPDKRFAFYLLAATGICVVPATDFESPYPGFRVTTLNRDPAGRDLTYRTLSGAIAQYLASG